MGLRLLLPFFKKNLQLKEFELYWCADFFNLPTFFRPFLVIENANRKSDFSHAAIVKEAINEYYSIVTCFQAAFEVKRKC